MTPEAMAPLLASMDAGRLLVLCGAGLSMAPPSGLPSARRVAELCFDAYRLRVDPALDPALRENLEALAEHFLRLGTFKAQFIENLVPWNEFSRQPNAGHAALADFLIARVVAACLSSNYDQLIERCAWSYGADFRGSLDGDEALESAHAQSPLLKIHGCSNRDREWTVWSPAQLGDSVIASRISKSTTWMAGHLRKRDLLIVGYWSDWAYLNGIAEAAFATLDPMSVTLIDVADEATLERKAPQLWELVHGPGITFTHVQESGADALDELRSAFSLRYLQQVMDAGREAFSTATGADCDPALLTTHGLDTEALYDWRRDAEGVPRDRPAVTNRPRNAELAGCFHLLMRCAGAVPQRRGYYLNGTSVRVVNGAGTVLSTIAARFVEAPAVASADVFVAAGSTDLGLPAHVVRAGVSGSVLRPGVRGEWLDFGEARKRLGV